MSKNTRNQRRIKPWMPLVKWITNRKDRQAVKQAIHHERYDDIPEGKRMYKDDEWFYD